MLEPLSHLIAFLVSAAIVLSTTPLVKAIGIKSGCVDRPNQRKVHHRPMVRLQGVAIFICLSIALLLSGLAVWY